jgi:3-deoxy-D-manno-octulosonic-acid transferase
MVLLRGLREREYWRGWRARFGFGRLRAGGGIWVHAVSVGEVQAAAVLIEALRERRPQLEITLSCATPTGRARATRIAARRRRALRALRSAGQRAALPARCVRGC